MLVLVVDDEESICELLALTLEDDYEILKAYNGKEALELIKQQPVALILTDLMMPYMSGLELLKAVRANPATKHIPVILTSAADLPRNHAQKADAYLNKPFDLALLQQTVARLITRQPDSENLKQATSPSNLNLGSEEPSWGASSPHSSINPPFQSLFDSSYFRRRNFPPTYY
jgi:CheY-like chemotaxis protein